MKAEAQKEVQAVVLLRLGADFALEEEAQLGPQVVAQRGTQAQAEVSLQAAAQGELQW